MVAGRPSQVRPFHCGKGHPFDEANTYVSRTGGRQCKTCNRERARTSARRKAGWRPDRWHAAFGSPEYRARAVVRLQAKYTVDRTTGCWMWTASRDNGGYSKVQFEGHLLPAHRVSYTLFVGEIPEGLEIDHLCRNRRCVNPSHLEPVTRSENLIRGHKARTQAASRPRDGVSPAARDLI